MNENVKHPNREAWLLAAVDLMRPHFKAKEYEVPPIRVSCGWPHTGGTAAKKRRLGECWPQEADAQGVTQIFVSPYLEDVKAPQGVLSVLVHELVHAVVGTAAKHGAKFRKCALAVGLTGKMTSTEAGEELRELFDGWCEALGDYPNAKLDLTKSPTKKQGTRMIKCECEDCGYTCRTTKKWLEEVGAPLCPAHKNAMVFEMPDCEDEEGEDE